MEKIVLFHFYQHTKITLLYSTHSVVKSTWNTFGHMLVFRDLYDFSQIVALEAFSGYNTLLQLPDTANLPGHRYMLGIF